MKAHIRVALVGVLLLIPIISGKPSTSLAITTQEEEASTKGDSYTARFPNSSWRHVDYVHEAQEFAAQKKEVIIAVISDKPQDSDYPFFDGSAIRPVQWVNIAEKNGVAGVDDDGNGYVDDIYGIDTIHIPNESLSLSNGIINLIAGTANYHPNRLVNPSGKVKLMLITAFHELDGESECSNYWYSNRTTNAALIEALEYATKMGAKVAFVSGHYTYEKSPLVIAAAAAFPGLIIMATDRDYDQECFGDTSMLLQAELENVIGVGTFLTRDDEMLWPFYGGEIDLIASITFESLLYRGNEGAVVAGVTAHLMSCYPELNRNQIKDLLLGSTDRVTDKHVLPSAHLGSTQTGGKLNAARAVLGRSAGGTFYIGDRALLDREGPASRSGFGIVYDVKKSLMYLYGGRDKDDFWCWNGKRWRELHQARKPGKYPGFIEPYAGAVPLLIDENRGEPIMISKDAVWRWNGSKWKMKPASLPRDGRYPLIFSQDDCAFDSKRNRIFIYHDFNKLGPRMIEFNGSEWNISDKQTPLPEFRTPLIFNKRLGMVTTMTATKENLYTGKLWGYDGNRWRHLRMKAVVGTKGKLIYDTSHNRYVRFSSENLGDVGQGTNGTTSYWEAPDIWQMKDGRWNNLGYDAPSFILRDNRYSVVWADDVEKALFVVSPITSSSNSLMTWQYSGPISPTWIDNLILSQSDYTGDGKADLCVWHPGSGEFQFQNGTIATKGRWGDIPALGDYDGDGGVEFTVCRRIPGKEPLDLGSMLWLIGDEKVYLGQFNDIPVPLDYDGDGRTDIATFHKDTAKWTFQDKKKNTTFGNPADLPVPADYNGDGLIELATYTPLTSTWHIQGIGEFQYGKPGDSPVPADYDGDGRADIATWNPRKQMWLVREWSSGDNMIKQRFGGMWDIPVQGDYDGDGAVELATYSPITSLWKINGRAPVRIGTAGDVPLVRGN